MTDAHDDAVAEPDLPPIVELTRFRPEDSDEILLLRQWLRWWASEMPAKLPGGLHVHTAVLLMKHDQET